MKRSSLLFLAGSAAIAWTPAAPALAKQSCKSTNYVSDSTGRYAITQGTGKTKTGIKRTTRVYIPEQQEYLSDVSMREHYKIITSLNEKQTRYWTRTQEGAATPYEVSKPKYEFIFVISLKRHDEKQLPDWAKTVKDSPIKTCDFYKDAKTKIYSTTAKSGKVCALTVNDKTKPKLAGLKFFEVRAKDMNNKEIYRGQYTIHYPQKVKDTIVQTSQGMDKRVVDNACVPFGG